MYKTCQNFKKKYDVFRFRQKLKLQVNSQKYAAMTAAIRVKCMAGGVTSDNFDGYSLDQLPILQACVRKIKEEFGFYNPVERRNQENGKQSVKYILISRRIYDGLHNA